MNFSQLHERLRLELLRRIEREVITASLLARKTGMRQPHISNFLRNKRRLSLPALDRVLAALELSVADLAAPRSQSSPNAARSGALSQPASTRTPPSTLASLPIPLISQSSAIHDDLIPPTTEYLSLPPSTVSLLRADHGARRPTRERFVAITLSPAQARPMEPILQPNSILVLDRHSTLPTSSFAPARPVYAVLLSREIHFGYLTFDRNLLILRPHSLAFPIQLLPVPPRLTPSDLVVGRVCAMLTPL